MRCEFGFHSAFACELRLQACHDKKPYSSMMAKDSMNRIHVRNSIAGNSQLGSIFQSLLGPTVAVSLCNALRTFSDRPFIGRRAETKDGLGAYEWTSFAD